MIDRLDLSSFNNSIGPRRAKDKITFAHYGFGTAKFSARRAIVTDAVRSWQFVVRLLSAQPDGITICLEDEALNGGTYDTQNAYVLRPDDIGYLKAMPIVDAACPAFAK